jgi:hypothetical protein
MLMAKMAAAHSGDDTPGIVLHHVPIWAWTGIAALITALVYIIYVQTHDKPLNPLDW